jgi:hypothetical protein
MKEDSVTTIEMEGKIHLIPLGPMSDVAAELNKLAAEGWQIVPGAPPFAVYYLTRQKPQAKMAEHAAQGTLQIDDSKIHVVRDGKIVG